MIFTSILLVLAALGKIAKPTYGTELCNSQEENNEIMARYTFGYQEIARQALLAAKQDKTK